MATRTSDSSEGASAANTSGPDMYGVRKCVEMYDAATQPVAHLVAAFLDAFEPAFLEESDLPERQLTDADDAKQRSQFLDVGCGSGSFTLKYLRPHLPSWCKRLVAADRSETMLQFARENRSDPLIDYRVMDVLADDSVEKFVQEHGCFQRVYSFMMLHWIADQRRAMKNIATLTAPGGECFVVFSKRLNAHRVFMAVKKSPEWAKYSQLLEDVLPETTEMDDTVSVRTYAAQLVHAAGLTPLACEVFHACAPGGIKNDSAGDFFTLMNPIHEKLNDDGKKELRKFTHRALEEVRKSDSGTASTTRDIIVIHACKPNK